MKTFPMLMPQHAPYYPASADLETGEEQAVQ